MNEVRIQTLCEQIDAEPLFHMSLGSKELFHSNFIAWFANTYPDAAAEVFGPWTTPSPSARGERTEREGRHLDVLLRLDGLAPLVIENKVFSVPTAHQLEGYATAVPVGASKVLLSLIPHAVDVDGWTARSYTDLADRLATQVPTLEAGGDSFSRDLVSHYISFVRLLVDLMSEVGIPANGEPLALPESVAGRLRRIRIDAGVQKSRVAAVAESFRQKALSRWNADDLILDFGLTRSMALISGYRKRANGDYLGWQLQGGDYRLAVKVGQRSRGRGRENRESHVTQTYPSWFDFSFLVDLVAGAVDPVPRPLRGSGFGSFEPDFCYRYVRCPDITPEEIIEAGLHYLDRAGRA